MINGVIAQKLQNIDTILIELRSLGCLTVQELDQDWRTKRAVERSLQILVEIVIDVCQRVLSLSGQTPATSILTQRESEIQDSKSDPSAKRRFR
jgi:uncharacterized protein YutE (UPF0331/DUF86 family)